MTQRPLLFPLVASTARHASQAGAHLETSTATAGLRGRVRAAPLVLMVISLGVGLALWLFNYRQSPSLAQSTSEAHGTADLASLGLKVLSEKPPHGSEGSTPATVGFRVYPQFKPAKEYQADYHINPSGKKLSENELASLDKFLRGANQELTKKQDYLTRETQEWGRLALQNNLPEDEHSLARPIEPLTTRVGVVENGRVNVVTVRPGDNAILDELCAELLHFVGEKHRHIREAFSGSPAPSRK